MSLDSIRKPDVCHSKLNLRNADIWRRLVIIAVSWTGLDKSRRRWALKGAAFFTERKLLLINFLGLSKHPASQAAPALVLKRGICIHLIGPPPSESTHFMLINLIVI